jgi:hypothetical protein
VATRFAAGEFTAIARSGAGDSCPMKKTMRGTPQPAP